MVLERLIGHPLDHIGWLREEFIPTPGRVNLSEQDGSDGLLLFFRECLRCGVRFVEKIRHG
jgi:hypothetical protein